MRGLFQVFKNKSMKRQMITVAMSLLAVFAVAQVASRFSISNPQNWELTTFESPQPPNISFEVELPEHGITATLINQSNQEIQASAAFELIFQTENNEWRIVPFHEDITFAAAYVPLPPNYRITHRLSSDMLNVNLREGTHRIRTTINHEESTGVQKNSTAWVEFELQ
jgi:hypothetical protein